MENKENMEVGENEIVASLTKKVTAYFPGKTNYFQCERFRMFDLNETISLNLELYNIEERL